MKPLVTFPDPLVAALGVLRPALAARAEPYASTARVSHKLPARTSSTAGADVLVASDGATGTYPVNERALVRVTVWHSDPNTAYLLASLCRALLVTHQGSAIRSAQPVSGPIPTVDPESATPLASVVVAAHLRPVAA